MSFDDDFDPAVAEIRELQILLGKGMEFTAGGKTYLIQQPVLGQLDRLSEQFLNLELNPDKLSSSDPMEVFGEHKRMVARNVKTCARIAAIAAVDHKGIPKSKIGWLIKAVRLKITVAYFAHVFYWSMTPADLLKLANIILRVSNMPDFTNSIALMSVARTTAPQAIED